MLRAASEVAPMRVQRSKTQKEELINQPRVSFWIEKIDDLLEENEESELSFDEFDLAGDISPEQLLRRTTRKSMRKSIAVMDVVQQEEMVKLYEQLEELREAVAKNEEEEVETKAEQEATMKRINQLFVEAEQTNQEFKDMPEPESVDPDQVIGFEEGFSVGLKPSGSGKDGK